MYDEAAFSDMSVDWLANCWSYESVIVGYWPQLRQFVCDNVLCGFLGLQYWQSMFVDTRYKHNDAGLEGMLSSKYYVHESCFSET